MKNILEDFRNIMKKTATGEQVQAGSWQQESQDSNYGKSPK